MVKFSDLSKRRREIVLLLLEIYPTTRETGTITLKEIKDYLAAVKAGKYKQPHHPAFLYTEHEFRTDTRGVYNIPMPDEPVQFDSSALVSRTRKTPRVIRKSDDDDELDFEIDTSVYTYEEFEAECKEAGII